MNAAAPLTQGDIDALIASLAAMNDAERQHFENVLTLRAYVLGWTGDPLSQPAESVALAYRQMQQERQQERQQQRRHLNDSGESAFADDADVMDRNSDDVDVDDEETGDLSDDDADDGSMDSAILDREDPAYNRRGDPSQVEGPQDDDEPRAWHWTDAWEKGEGSPFSRDD